MSYRTRIKVATLHLVDPRLMRAELTLRRVTCEMPDCPFPAVGIADSGVCAFLCDHHFLMWGRNPQAARAIEQTVIQVLTLEVANSTNAAYEGTENETIIVFDGTQDLVKQALGRSVTDATQQVLDHEERLASVPKVETEPTFTASPGKANPTLSTLPSVIEVDMTGLLF